MAILYTSVSGRQITSHSHSGGQDWSCPRKYKYKRIDGWSTREDKVSTEFGKAVEKSIQFHHTSGREKESGVDEFKQLWWKLKDEPLEYTEKSGDWDDHYRMGVELLTLYEMTLPNLPILNEKFQQDYNVDLFPTGPGEGLKYTGKIDVISEVPADYPGLPENGVIENGNRKIIIDIKTSAHSYFTDPRLAALDEQLRDYAWMTGINTVSFLVLVKNFSELTVGDWVTVLRGPKAGKKYQVIDNTLGDVVVLTKSDYDDYMTRKKKLRGKGAKEKAEELLTEYTLKGYPYARADLTKTKIQFLCAVVPQEDMEEAKKQAQDEAYEISCYASENFFPKKPGVRFPNNPCTNCECLGLCINDPQMVKEKLIQIDGIF